MSKGQTLADRIKALAEEEPTFDGRARVLASSTIDVVLILDEIDASVLPAALKCDGGPVQMTLQVAGRRLHGIADVAGLDVPDSLEGQTLSMEDEGLRMAAARLLEAFAARSIGLKVTADTADPALADNPESLSVSGLRQALGLDDEDADLPPFERLFNRILPHSEAVLRLQQGQLVSTEGDPARATMLKVSLTTQLQTFLQERENRCPSHTEPSLTFFADVLEPGIGISVATFTGETLLAAVKTEALSDHFRSFARVL